MSMSPPASKRLPQADLPGRLVVDANVVVGWAGRAFQQSRSGQDEQAEEFVKSLEARTIDAIIPPMAFAEIVHTMIRFRYEHELRTKREELAKRFGMRITSWTLLYKLDQSILRHFLLELERLRVRKAAAGLIIASPNDLTPLPADQPFEKELVRMIGRYGLDTSDCLILMEAARLGVRSVVTMDRDLLRAQSDFDIYTW